MFSLLSRFAWMISLLFSLFGWSLLFDSFDERIFNTLWFFGWVLVFLGAALIKKIFLSEDFIRSSLGKTLESGVEDMIESDTIWENSFKKESLLSEIISPSDISDSSEEEVLSPSKEANTPSVMQDIPTMLLPDEPSVLGVWIRNFFSDRPLAKVGGILLFLGALFFLYLVFDAVGPVGKVLIGMIFGVVLILVGAWIDTKDMKTESRVLLGIGIAVNYLTILSGRHLLSGGSISTGPLFSDTFATIALLLNSALAVALALTYRSNILLGFSFIFAYATPFLVASESSSVILLTLYATILTTTIATLIFFYSRMDHTASRDLLEGISIIGMAILFSLAMNHASGVNIPLVFMGLFFSVLSLGIPLYREKRSPIALLIGAYFVLFIASFSIDSIVFPIGLMALFLFALAFLFISGISIVLYGFFGMISLILCLFSFWFHSGVYALLALLGTGIGISLIFGFALSRVYSSQIGNMSVIGLAIFLFLGISTTSLDTQTWSFIDIFSMKAMALFLLIFGSVFALRMRDMMMYFFSVVLSGILLVYPNCIERAPDITLMAYVFFGIITFLVPAWLLHWQTGDKKSLPWLYTSFPVSSLILAYAIYQAGQVYFPGIMLGVAYIIQGVVSLGYAMLVLRGTLWVDAQGTKKQTMTSSLPLVLLAIPLSLFTFSIAFLFRDIPGMMSLAWVVESVILYFVYSQKWDIRIQYVAHIILAIGIIKEITLVHSLMSEDWASLPSLFIMLGALFLSLFFLRNDTTRTRGIYDVLHMIGMVVLGYGIGSIIPHTNVGWSLLGATAFVGVLAGLYAYLGRRIHYAFHSLLFLGAVLLYLERFDTLNIISGFPLLVQMMTLIGFLSIAYYAYRTKHPFAWFQLWVGVIGTLILSSWYVREFFGTFAVSLYFTVIASILIIRGIVRDIPILRAIGLYIGIFVLLKIFFHDIWIGNNGTFTRVIALMVTGGTMIYLSQLYGKYVSRSWSEELRISNFFSGWNTNISDPELMETDPFLGVLQQDLSHIDISGYSGIQFQTKNGDQFVVRRASVLRLAKHITDTYRRTTFQPHELESAYQFVLSNLESTMPKKDLDMLLEKIKMWIEQGGSVNYISKS